MDSSSEMLTTIPPDPPESNNSNNNNDETPTPDDVIKTDSMDDVEGISAGDDQNNTADGDDDGDADAEEKSNENDDDDNENDNENDDADADADKESGIKKKETGEKNETVNGQKGDEMDDGDDKANEKGDENDTANDSSNNNPINLGGPLDKQSFALLTGQYEDVKENTKTIIKVPITALPAILGRTQKTTNEHIFDLGNCKALSRKHAVIFYSDVLGGKLGKYTDDYDAKSDYKVDDDWHYKRQHPSKKPSKNVDIIRPQGVELPPNGFYAIECISKNKLFVNKKRVEQGQVALLTNKTTIRMAGYCLYFLLPEDGPPAVTSVDIPNLLESVDSDDDGCVGGPPSKKMKRGELTPSKSDLCDGKSLHEMLEEFIDAIDKDVFERKHSLISSSIMSHAVRDVSRSPELQKMSKDDNGVSRTEIMDWIGKNDLYEQWVVKLLTKLEIKSYQANLSKALMKAGFTRIGTTGRHVKWVLPHVKATRKRKSKAIEKETKEASTGKEEVVQNNNEEEEDVEEKAKGEESKNEVMDDGEEEEEGEEDQGESNDEEEDDEDMDGDSVSNKDSD